MALNFLTVRILLSNHITVCVSSPDKGISYLAILRPVLKNIVLSSVEDNSGCSVSSASPPLLN